MSTISNRLRALLARGGLLVSFALLCSCTNVNSAATLSIQLRNSGNESVFDCAVFYLDTQERINGLFSMELVPTGTARHTGFPYRVPEALGVEWFSTDGEKHTGSVVASSLVDKSVDGVLLIEVNHPQVTSSFVEEPPIDWAARLTREPHKLRPYMIFEIENFGNTTIDGLRVIDLKTNEDLQIIRRRQLKPKDGFRSSELLRNPPTLLEFHWETDDANSNRSTVNLDQDLPEDFMGVVWFSIVDSELHLSWKYTDESRRSTRNKGGYRFSQ